MNRILDIVCAALLAAALILGALAVWQPWEADVSAAVAVHAAAPLDVNAPVLVRYEVDGVEFLPPEVMPLWRYVFVPQQETAARLSGLESALEHDIHSWRTDCRLMLTHDFIDNEVHIKNGDGGQ